MIDFFMSRAFLWILVAIIAIAYETRSSTRIALWFAPAGIVASILDLMYAGLIEQLIVFAATYLLGLLLWLGVFKKLTGYKRPQKQRKEPMVGDIVIVVETINNA